VLICVKYLTATWLLNDISMRDHVVTPHKLLYAVLTAIHNNIACVLSQLSDLITMSVYTKMQTAVLVVQVLDLDCLDKRIMMQLVTWCN